MQTDTLIFIHTRKGLLWSLVQVVYQIYCVFVPTARLINVKNTGITKLSKTKVSFKVRENDRTSGDRLVGQSICSIMMMKCLNFSNSIHMNFCFQLKHFVETFVFPCELLAINGREEFLKLLISICLAILLLLVIHACLRLMTFV